MKDSTRRTFEGSEVQISVTHPLQDVLLLLLYFTLWFAVTIGRVKSPLLTNLASILHNKIILSYLDCIIQSYLASKLQ